MNTGEVLALVHQLVDTDPRQREMGADRLTDFTESYSPRGIKLLTRLLSLCACSEPDRSALESQLNALLELCSTGLVERESLSRLMEIDRFSVPSDLLDYVDDLLKD